MSVMCPSYNTPLGTTPFPWLLHPAPNAHLAPSTQQFGSLKRTRSPCIAFSAEACHDQKQSCSGCLASRECSGGLRSHWPCGVWWRAQQRAAVYAAQARKCGAIRGRVPCSWHWFSPIGRTLRWWIFAGSAGRLRKEETPRWLRDYMMSLTCDDALAGLRTDTRNGWSMKRAAIHFPRAILRHRRNPAAS